MREHRCTLLLEPWVQEINAVQLKAGLDPMRLFRLEEEMLLLGVGSRAAREQVYEEADAGSAIEERLR